MKVIARVHFNRYPTQHHVAVYQDGVGIRQTHEGVGISQQDIWLDFDEIEEIAKLARKHRKLAARLEAEDNARMAEV